MPLKWRKTWISDETYECALVCDVDSDGAPDIVSGAFWYRGPDFREKHHMGAIKASGEYYDDFSPIAMDINGNGRPDVLTGGWWGQSLRWRENPGEAGGEWTERVIAETGSIETTRAWDVDGDGVPEIVPNTPGGPLKVYKLVTGADGRGTGRFVAHTVRAEPQGHGLGFGDISGSGRGDFVLNGGWLEAPPEPFAGEWTFHPFDQPLFRGASVPILVADVNGDGLNDLVVGNGHDYGLDWFEQVRDGEGPPAWRRHAIDPFNAQYHDLQWADIDGDGACELVTGKRHRAHCGNDPGEWDDLGIYYFKWTGEGFAKQVIDYGPIGAGKGCGLAFALADLRGSGRLDLVAPGKDGLYVYFNEGAA